MGGKCGRFVWLTTLPPSCADCVEIWEPQPPGTLRACPVIALPLLRRKPLLSSSGCGSPGKSELMCSTSVHCRIFYTHMISQLTHLYKYVQSDVIILQLHVSINPVIIISVAFNKNTINIQIIIQKCVIKPIDITFDISVVFLMVTEFYTKLHCH